MAALYESDDAASDISGFSEDEIGNYDERSVGSDISISDVSDVSSVSSLSDESDEEMPNDQRDMWTRTLSKPNIAVFSEEVGATFTLDEAKTERDFFRMFFPVALLENLVVATNVYAALCILNKPDPNWIDTTVLEMEAFLGLHLLFSVIQIPTYSMAWSGTWPFAIPSVPEIMTRTRYERLCKYFHVNDTSGNPPRGQPGHDRLCHVRPLLTELSKSCLDNYRPHKEQSIDEGMIAYKGRLSFKQYLPAKPTKFGIKVWERADPHNGYVHEFQIYTGKQDGQRIGEEGLGSRVVKDLTRNIVGKAHHVYMDNFFSNPKLYEDLEKDQVYCSGTVRVNRKGMPEAVKAKLTNRGDSIQLQKGNLVCTAWKDKKPVYYLSTCVDPTQPHVVRRRQKDGTVMDIQAPQIADKYNKYMFGVDLADQKRMQYSTCRKAKKWWKYLFWFCFDIAVVNSFICFQESENHKKTTKTGREVKRRQLDFRRALATQLFGTFRGSRKRKLVSTKDNCGNSHWPTQFDKPGRCKQCSKEKRRHEVSVGCKQCGVRLCIKNDCFYKYHKDLLK